MGYGVLEFSGTASNTYASTTTVNEGTLKLAKSSGLNAIGGALVVGDGSTSATTSNGGLNSDVVELVNSGQIPSATAPVTILASGELILDNNVSTTIGNEPGEVALTMTGGNIVINGGTLTLNGEVVSNASVISSTITGSGNLDLGNAPRTFTVTASASIINSMVISANIVNATGGSSLIKQGTGALLLMGNNTYNGSTYLNAGFLDIGSSTALGTGTVFMTGSLLVSGGPQSLSNSFVVSTTFSLGAVGTGGFADADPLTLSGAVSLVSATTTTLTIANPTYITVSGGIGDNFTDQSLTKSGTGFLVLTAPNTYSGNTTVNDGSLILTGQGELVNTTSITLNPGGTLDLDNTSGNATTTNTANSNLPDRVYDGATIALTGGTLLFRGYAGAASTETLGAVTINTSQFSGTTQSQPGIISEVDTTNAASTVAVTIASLTRGTGANINFVGLGAIVGSTINQIILTASPALVGGILPYATLETYPEGNSYSNPNTLAGIPNMDFATQLGASQSIQAAPFSTSLTAGANVKLTGGSFTLTNSMSVNGLLLSGGASLNLGTNTLTIGSGELMAVGNNNQITGTAGSGLLNFGSLEGFIFTEAPQLEVENATGTLLPTLNISASINATNNSLRKERAGMLTLSGDNSGGVNGVAGSVLNDYVVVDQGSLNVQNSNALGTVPNNTVVTVTITNANNGTFPLTYGGETTGQMPYNDTAADVQAQLTALNTTTGNATTIGAGGVIVSGPTGGTFTLSFGGKTTSPIQINATPATVEADLVALTSIGTTSNVAVGGVANDYLIAFTGALSGTPISKLGVGTVSAGVNATITGPDVAVTSTYSTTQTIAETNVTGGTFTLIYNGATTSTVSPLQYNATAAQVQSALEHDLAERTDAGRVIGQRRQLFAVLWHRGVGNAGVECPGNKCADGAQYAHGRRGVALCGDSHVNERQWRPLYHFVRRCRHSADVERQ